METEESAEDVEEVFFSGRMEEEGSSSTCVVDSVKDGWVGGSLCDLYSAC